MEKFSGKVLEEKGKDLGGGRETSWKKFSLPLQTSLSLQELSPRQPQWYVVRIFDKGGNEVILGKVFFVFGRYGAEKWADVPFGWFRIEGIASGMRKQGRWL